MSWTYNRIRSQSSDFDREVVSRATFVLPFGCPKPPPKVGIPSKNPDMCTRQEHSRGGIVLRHQHSRVHAADVQKISSEVFRAGAQSKGVCGHYLLHRSVIVIHAQLSRMIYMCMFFTLIILYLEVCLVQSLNFSSATTTAVAFFSAFQEF